MVTESEIVLRLVIAAALGAIVGIERERASQPAGMRTHLILTLGSALAMTLSINLAIQFRPLVPNGDPARLAAQVISGIGFLGAGAILRFGTNVKGLTTATSLWTMAVVGLVVGAGNFLGAVTAVVILLTALTLLNTFEERFIRTFNLHIVTILAEDRPGQVDALRERLAAFGTRVNTTGLQKDIGQNLITVTIEMRLDDSVHLAPLSEAISSIEGVRSFEIH